MNVIGSNEFNIHRDTGNKDKVYPNFHEIPCTVDGLFKAILEIANKFD